MVRNINFGKLTPIVFPFKASTRRKFAMGWVGITAAQLLFNFVTKTLDFTLTPTTLFVWGIIGVFVTIWISDPGRGL